VHSAKTLSLIETVVDAVESFEPAVIRPSLQTYLVSQRIHQDRFRVALCGEGADELFAGYPPLGYAFSETSGVGRHMQKQCLSMMHRANLQRIDRCSMQFALEIREPFLDLSVVGYASGLDESVFVNQTAEAPVGKAQLRALYDLYPSVLPTLIRDRQKLPFHGGAGGDVEGSGWLALFEDALSDSEFHGRAARIFRLSNRHQGRAVLYADARRKVGCEAHTAFARAAPIGHAARGMTTFLAPVVGDSAWPVTSVFQGWNRLKSEAG